jgi:ornithine carbamoyltransferase
MKLVYMKLTLALSFQTPPPQQELAKYSSVPIINALTAKYHPLQILADVMTLYETYVPESRNIGALVPSTTVSSSPSTHSQISPCHPLPPLPANLNVAWIGDANNILNSLLVTLPRLGVNLNVATPKGYPVDQDVKEYVESLPSIVSTPSNNSASGAVKEKDAISWELGKVTYTHSAAEALQNADVIITDTWVSMGQEAEKKKRLSDFAGFQVTEAMAKNGGAKQDWKFMHCLPRKQEEVDDEVFYNTERSLVWEEAENRKYTVMAVFEALMTKKVEV